MQRRMILLSVALAGCASAGPAATPQRTTTTVSVPVSSGGHSGTVNLELDAYRSGAPVVTVLAAPRERVWEALDSAYAALRIPVGTRDPANWTLGNRQFVPGRRIEGRPLSSFVDCGSTALGTGIADTYRVELSVLSVVRPEGTGTRLETSVQGTARQPGTTNTPVHCSSTGALEAALVEKLRLALGG